MTEYYNDTGKQQQYSPQQQNHTPPDAPTNKLIHIMAQVSDNVYVKAHVTISQMPW